MAIDAIEHGVFRGVVERIAIEATTTESRGTGFPVGVRIEGPAPDQEPPPDLGLARVGMSSSVEIITQRQEADLVVPSRALLDRGDETVAFVGRDGAAYRVPVKVAVLGDDTATRWAASRRSRGSARRTS